MSRTLAPAPVADDLTVRLQSISEFLRKPLKLGTLTWNTVGQLKGYELASYSASTQLITKPVFANKIEGFNLVRGTACLRLQMVGNPFQAGALLIRFLPNLSSFASYDASYAAMHNACIATMRQQPCVEVQVKDAAAVLKIPFIAPSNWCKIGTGYYDWGTFYVNVLSPLATGIAGEQVVQVTPYIYFEDIELAAPIKPQSTGLATRKSRITTIKGYDAELEALEHKPLSQGLRKAAEAGDLLSRVPLLSSVARPATWALEAGAGVASFLGYSKPVNDSQPTNVTRVSHRYLATADGVDTALPLGLSMTNSVATSEAITPNVEDEMAFMYLKSIGTCIHSARWLTSTLESVEIYGMEVTPANLYEEGHTDKGGHSVVWRAGPPVYYVHNDFGLWRGGIEFTLKFIKTALHVGKLEVTFTPNYPITTTPDTVSSVYALREIIDIRDADEVTLVCPYLITTDYLAMGEYSGRFSVKVLNELRAPETVAESIEMLVYVRGAEDLEFQGPAYLNGLDNRSMAFSPQMNMSIREGVGSEPIPRSINPIYSTSVGGEMFCSVKQLLKRSMIVNARTTLPQNGNGAVTFWPWARGVAYLSAAGVLSGPNIGGDMFSKLAPMYAYFRGGMDVTLRTTQIDSAGAGRNNVVTSNLSLKDPLVTLDDVITAGQLMSWDGPHDWLNAGTRTGSQGYAISDASTGVHSFRIPYYGRTKCSLNLLKSSTNTIPSENSQPWTNVTFTSQSAFANYCLFRNVADDFQFAYFIGAPPLFHSYT